MVMLGSADNASQWGRQVAQPDEIGMRETQSPCVIVADTDAHYARAKDAGATIVMDIADQDYGGRGYSCPDIVGHLLWVRSYDPCTEPAFRYVFRQPPRHGTPRPPPRPRPPDAPAPGHKPLPLTAVAAGRQG